MLFLNNDVKYIFADGEREKIFQKCTDFSLLANRLRFRFQLIDYEFQFVLHCKKSRGMCIFCFGFRGGINLR